MLCLCDFELYSCWMPLIMLNYIPLFNFVYSSYNVFDFILSFQGFLRRKTEKNLQRVVVLDMVEISKDFPIFIDLKISETRFILSW